MLGTVDAVSGASNYFLDPCTFTNTAGSPFTNNVTIASYGTDPGAYTTITFGANTSVLTVSGQTTTNGLPPGYTLKFVDTQKTGGLYDAIYGNTTNIGTSTMYYCLLTFSIF